MSEYQPQTVAFDRLPSQGVVYGISLLSVIALLVAVLTMGISVISQGFMGIVTSLPVTAPLATLALVKIQGETLLIHTLREIGGHMRKATGATSYKKRPELKKPSPTGALDLPGRDGRIHLYEAENGAVVVWDAKHGVATISCMVATPGLGQPQADSAPTLTPEQRDALIFEWAKVLGSFTQKQHITRVTVIEQTRPGTVAAERRYFEDQLLSEVTGVQESYREALELADQAVVAHLTQLTISFTVSGNARTLVKGAGGGIRGLLGLAELEMQTAEEALILAGFTRLVWVTPREWGAWAKSLIDPAGQSSVDRRILTEWQGVDPQAATPMLIEEKRTSVETDSAWHRTFWINEWPRYETHPGFLSRMVFARKQTGEPVRHTFALIGTPTQVSKAMKKIEEQKRTWITNQKLRAKSGKPDSAADEADWENLLQHETDLVGGQGELQFTAYLTVTATSEDALEAEAASMLNACTAAGLEPRPVVWQQTEALLNVAYPCGAGMK
ncbi:hypothetical protein QBL02_03700 [Leucobacter sp. UT-8R-CII-1-4]|uniref:SCO6880 family protein n=1 Tax=Leucobacter sp. UT-8R-CII-1-4 TaxID=3040075 RepID=UPI0024A8131F|nr:SCO6880 family protein [Leucobacter sp. UT-8R-CII-1-4]MDI6022644.1 hypothetical protein [Leucobacter sp. UT-8R-CII-1-4]